MDVTNDIPRTVSLQRLIAQEDLVPACNGHLPLPGNREAWIGGHGALSHFAREVGQW